MHSGDKSQVTKIKIKTNRLRLKEENLKKAKELTLRINNAILIEDDKNDSRKETPFDLMR